MSSMWWPSFCSVVQDLWRFAIGLDSEALYVSARVHALPAQSSVLQISEQTTAPKQQKLVLDEHVRYTAQHATTAAIRSYLHEETTIKTAPADLTPYEWLAYTLTKAGRPLPWLALALAPIGYWHQALKGQQYVTIGVVPRTQSLIEWQDEQKTGQVGLVTAVTPDESITIEQLGAGLPGMLTKRVLTLEQWRELRPVFISVR